MKERDEIFDYPDATTAVADEGVVKQLSVLTDQAKEAAAEVDRCEARLEAAQNRYNMLVERDIPELMDRIGMATFKTTSGIKVTVKRSVHASLVPTRKTQALEWLEAIGEGGAIKHRVEVQFGRDEALVANALATELGKNHQNVRNDASVHHSTLSAIIRTRMEEGESVPQDLIAIHEKRVAQLN